ncbi:solute carrier family 22 member 7 [Rhincodon typus]|uniref:solute carrier family 22 member 7 n=1 Tax=Rhincodon typus TaxID=259920 RepID=UPI00203082F4|nr:solute carrier family 22 member 7 [Rhincodon typus]
MIEGKTVDFVCVDFSKAFDNVLHGQLIQKWDLVCEKRSLNQAATSIFFIGVALGALLFGYLSDKFGRRKTLLLAFLFTMVAGTLASFSTSYPMFVVFRMLCGVGLTGISIISITLSVEWTDVEHRAAMAIIPSPMWSVGNMLLALIAYLIRDWRWLLFAVTSPCLVAAALCWWIPESARWLLANGKTKEAQVSLRKCAKVNKRLGSDLGLSSEVLDKIIDIDEGHDQYWFWHLVKSPGMRKLTFCTGIIWFGTAFSYYSISFSMNDYGFNVYLMQFIYGAIELPAKLITYILLKWIGRRCCQGWFLILTSLLMTFNLFMTKDHPILQLVIAIFAKGSSEAAFTTALLYTVELFPTVVR